MRDHVRLTIQPFDGPNEPEAVARLVDQLQSDDMLLFSSDFPHWQFDGDEIMPVGIPQRLNTKIRRDNALATYGRLAEAVA